MVLDAGLLRGYPHGEILAHIVGYVGAVNAAERRRTATRCCSCPSSGSARAGSSAATSCAARPGRAVSRVEVNAIGRVIRELDRREGEPGQDVQLSLDLELQSFCVARLSSELSASAVVLDVRTGGVLALASVPSFDPDAFTGRLRQSVWGELRDNPRTPLVNKCIRGQYPPGSTFKMMTALAALEAGGRARVPGLLPRLHRPGLGPLPLLEGARPWPARHGPALGQSCDVYFYELARRVGIDAHRRHGQPLRPRPRLSTSTCPASSRG